MRILLFGPPGCGKTTMVESMLRHGVPGFDLETLSKRDKNGLWRQDVYLTRLHQLKLEFTDVVVGGAALLPRRDYPGWIKVLILPPREQYLIRRENRDLDKPAKLGQTQASKAWRAFYELYQGGVFDVRLTSRNGNIANDVLHVRQLIACK